MSTNVTTEDCTWHPPDPRGRVLHTSPLDPFPERWENPLELESADLEIYDLFSGKGKKDYFAGKPNGSSQHLQMIHKRIHLFKFQTELVSPRPFLRGFLTEDFFRRKTASQT